MGMENTSALANFAMGPRGAIPRTPIENTRNSTGDVGNFRDFTVLHRAARMAVIGVARLNVLTLGSPQQDARARSFARFVQGVAFGNLALAYDSAAIVSENDDPQAIVALSSYTDVMAAALVELDSAITIARASPTGFPLPAAWISGNALDTTGYFRFIRSYKARFRASVGRSPAARAAADWNAIIADANAGITADFTIAMNPAAGWDVVWPVQAFATGPANWHQMSQFWMGMADGSGGYDSWLAITPANRAPFLVVSADKRFPQGASRGAQIADTLRTGFRTFSGFPYVRARQAGEDQPGQPLQISMYDFYRSRAFFVAGRIGADRPLARDQRRAAVGVRDDRYDVTDSGSRCVCAARARRRRARGTVQGIEMRHALGCAEVGVPHGDDVHRVRHVVLRRTRLGGSAARHGALLAGALPGDGHAA